MRSIWTTLDLGHLDREDYFRWSYKGGGGGGGSQSTQTIQKADPWSGAQPTIRAALQALGGTDPVGSVGGWFPSPLAGTPRSFFPGSTVAPFSPETQAALGMGSNAALMMGPQWQLGNRLMSQTMGGAYLPGFAQAQVPQGMHFQTGLGINPATGKPIVPTAPGPPVSDMTTGTQTGMTIPGVGDLPSDIVQRIQGDQTPWEGFDLPTETTTTRTIPGTPGTAGQRRPVSADDVRREGLPDVSQGLATGLYWGNPNADWLWYEDPGTPATPERTESVTTPGASAEDISGLLDTSPEFRQAVADRYNLVNERGERLGQGTPPVGGFPPQPPLPGPAVPTVNPADIVTDSVASQVLPAVQSRFTAGNRSGSPAMAEAMARGMARGIAPYQYGLYDQERQRQMQSLALTPQQLQAGMIGPGAMGQVGGAYDDQAQRLINESIARHDFRQTEPWERAGALLSAGYGAPGGSSFAETTGRMSSPRGNPLGSILGLGMMGAGLFGFPGLGLGAGLLGDIF